MCIWEVHDFDLLKFKQCIIANVYMLNTSSIYKYLNKEIYI